MSWILIAALYLIGQGWCMTELESKCIADYNEDFDNSSLMGTWYFIQHFSWSSLLPTTECPTFTYERPNSTDVKRYKDYYSKPNSPFSVTDNPIHEDGGYYKPSGYLVGQKQAKFFIMDPNSVYYKPPFTVRIYQRINDEFVLYNDCNSRMHWGWLMSRTRSPSQEKVDAAIASHKELGYMGTRKFCSSH